jgi:hypothetical protein
LLLWWRAKVYAHTDREGGRTAKITPGSVTGRRIIEWNRSDFPVGRMAEALALFQTQRKRFDTEAETLQQALDAELASS